MVFSACVGELFDQKMYTANVHLVSHVADMTEAFGPLSAYSAYAQESNLGYAKTLIFGSNGFLRQGMTRLLEGVALMEPKNTVR